MGGTPKVRVSALQSLQPGWEELGHAHTHTHSHTLYTITVPCDLPSLFNLQNISAHITSQQACEGGQVLSCSPDVETGSERPGGLLEDKPPGGGQAGPVVRGPSWLQAFMHRVVKTWHSAEGSRRPRKGESGQAGLMGKTAWASEDG